MADLEQFHDLMRRVRACDEAAERELCDRYEPMICRHVRWKARRRFGPGFDPRSICQEALKSFILDARHGSFGCLEDPDGLWNLLRKIADGKLSNRVRLLSALKRRPPGELVGGLVDDPGAGCRRPDGTVHDVLTPQQMLIRREELDRVEEALCRLEPKEQDLLNVRLEQELPWKEIARKLGGGEDAVRKQYERLLDRLRHQLEEDETSDE
jgi:RNA polymerase sigma factor (sigma-70 family)